MKITYIVTWGRKTSEVNSSQLDETIEAFLDLGAEVDDISILVQL